MSALPSPRLHHPDSAPSLPARRRAIWHQRLIDAEGGLRLALRADSTLHVHLFVASLVAVVGGVLGFEFVEWIVIAVGFLAISAAEIFHQAVQSLVSQLNPGATGIHRKTLRLSTAATLTVALGFWLASTCIIARHLWLIFR
ncbi:MAG: diacylglycerol kinase [Planctomycetaceae bacterium]